MRRRTFVTGFTQFGGFAVNPSALLAESCARPFELLEVSFAVVDDFLERLASRPESFDRLLMLGLRAGGATIEAERLARNHVGDGPDVRGEIRGPGPVEPGGPKTLAGTLLNDDRDARPAFSDDAGCYLCNYVYYRALRLLPDKRVGFVHVPPQEVIPIDEQRTELALLLDAIESC